MGEKTTYFTNLDRIVERPRNFIISIDGTWNDPSDAQEEGSGITNVLRLHKAVTRDDDFHMARYLRGVGNEEQHGFLGRTLGGALGWGAFQIRDQAYAILVTNYRPGDRIFLFGFSRGAAIARMLANHIHEEGIPEALTIEKDASGRIVNSTAKGERQPVDIEVMGVWDTVGAFGIPVNLFGIPFQRINLFRDLTVAPNVKKAYHLVAIDENRDPFVPSLMNHDPARIEEVWFAGVHADVGGGYDPRRLADTTLRFMLNRAEEHGVVFHPSAVDEVMPNPSGQGVLHKHKEKPGDYKMSPRVIGVSKDDDIDPAVKPRIHKSAIARMEAGIDGYAPGNLAALGQNFDVDDRD